MWCSSIDACGSRSKVLVSPSGGGVTNYRQHDVIALVLFSEKSAQSRSCMYTPKRMTCLCKR